MIERVVSGGQTGADRGGLDAAIDCGVLHAGFCPRGRRAEDGRIPDQYNLEETRSQWYGPRTRLNVRVSDGSVLFVRGGITPGTRNTLDLHTRKPALLIDLDERTEEEAVQEIAAWASWHGIRTLNVAGSRESRAPGIQAAVRRIVGSVLRILAGGLDTDDGG